eukprot:5544255-Alexandrium_andersonii.AAC.1
MQGRSGPMTPDPPRSTRARRPWQWTRPGSCRDRGARTREPRALRPPAKPLIPRGDLSSGPRSCHQAGHRARDHTKPGPAAAAAGTAAAVLPRGLPPPPPP